MMFACTCSTAHTYRKGLTYELKRVSEEEGREGARREMHVSCHMWCWLDLQSHYELRAFFPPPSTVSLQVEGREGGREGGKRRISHDVAHIHTYIII